MKSIFLCLVVCCLALTACSRSTGFKAYAELIGMARDEIADKLKDDGTAIDEGGLAFSKSGIRVWFDENGKAVDIYINSKSTDFGGAKIGETIESFQKAFGTPVKEDTESAYAVFASEGLFLDVNYDSKTLKVVAVHILKELQ